MKHAVTSPPDPISIAEGRGRVHAVPAWTDNLVWLLECTSTGAVAAIDGPEAAPVLAYCEARGLKLATILNTHTHGDHIGINRELQKSGALESLRVVGCKAVAEEIPGLTEPVDEGDEVRVGELVGTVMRTEGHIDGHVSYVFYDALFCGDTMFGAGCGYLFDGPPSKMHASLQRLAGLDANTKVFCAHEYTQDNLRFAWSVEPNNEALAQRIRETWALRAEGRSSVPSTIGLERATNPFVRVDSPELASNVRRLMSSDDAEGAALFAATRALKDRKDYKKLDEADLPIA